MQNAENGMWDENEFNEIDVLLALENAGVDSSLLGRFGIGRSSNQRIADHGHPVEKEIRSDNASPGDGGTTCSESPKVVGETCRGVYSSTSAPTKRIPSAYTCPANPKSRIPIVTARAFMGPSFLLASNENVHCIRNASRPSVKEKTRQFL